MTKDLGGRSTNIKMAAAKAKRHLLGSSAITVTITISTHDGKTRAVTVAEVEHSQGTPSVEEIAEAAEAVASVVDKTVEDAIQVAFAHVNSERYGTVSVEIKRESGSIVHTRTLLKDHFPEDISRRYYIRRQAG